MEELFFETLRFFGIMTKENLADTESATFQDQTVQMLVRLGYATPPSPSPRRDLGDLILR